METDPKVIEKVSNDLCLNPTNLKDYLKEKSLTICEKIAPVDLGEMDPDPEIVKLVHMGAIGHWCDGCIIGILGEPQTAECEDCGELFTLCYECNECSLPDHPCRYPEE